MANLIYQGKIIRQFWGNLIRQSPRHFSKTSGSQYVNWGGVHFMLKDKNDLLCP